MGSVQIKGAQIVDSAIEAAKLASNAVTSVKIADNAITSGKLGASSVLTAALNDAAVTAQKLGSAAVETAKIADDAVTSAKLAAGAVDSAALGSLAVTTAKLADAGVSAAKLSSNAVETSKINDGAVTTAKIAADAVDASKLDESDNYSFSGTVSVPTPSASGHAANKSYVDSVAAGLSVKENVRVATDSNVDISSLPANIDGIAMSNGDRVLLFGQTDDTENGVYSYTSSGSSMSRASDMDAGSRLPRSLPVCARGQYIRGSRFCLYKRHCTHTGSRFYLLPKIYRPRSGECVWRSGEAGRHNLDRRRWSHHSKDRGRGCQLCKDCGRCCRIGKNRGQCY